MLVQLIDEGEVVARLWRQYILRHGLSSYSTFIPDQVRIRTARPTDGTEDDKLNEPGPLRGTVKLTDFQEVPLIDMPAKSLIVRPV